MTIRARSAARLRLGLISPALFAMLVIMALVTTFATIPILHLLSRGQAGEDADLAASRAS